MRKLFLAALGLALSCGCRASAEIGRPEDAKYLQKRYYSNSYPDNPVPGLRKVGIVALDATIERQPDLAALSAALYSELQQVEGLEVIPNALTLQAAQAANLVLPRDGLKLADALGADGVFVAIITEYEPYGEPSVAMVLTLFSRAAPAVRRADMDKVIQGGRPLDLPRDDGLKPITAVFGVFDSSQAATRTRVKWFGEARAGGSPGVGWERYYRTMPRFFEFVSYEMVWKTFNHLLVDVSQKT